MKVNLLQCLYAGLLAMILVACGTPAPPAATADAIGLEVGQLAPDFTTDSLEGQPVTLSGLRGSVVLLNFWATWCGPCRIEMPGFEREFRRFAGQGFVVLAVNNAETAETASAFRDQFGLSFPIALDERGTIQEQFGIVNYPSTLLIDRDGRIVSRIFGVVPPAQITALLAEQGLTPPA